MAKQKQEKRWWVSRDRTGVDFYQFHYACKKPKTIAGDVYPSGDAVLLMRGEEFQRVFTFKLRKGACKEIEHPTLVLK